ncbi:MAG TPA: O-phospho-L-seryl-tRNA:Cys-tRNA synthase, partial [Candidatus Methanomethylia archaeon]|nr:O-phospho-L-seryl-tRNA:Cys-tRNA synthase [Candidatus Methanomethylicia archaeon]
MSLERFREIRREVHEDEVINLNPIQRGGVLTPAARRALVEFG